MAKGWDYSCNLPKSLFIREPNAVSEQIRYESKVY